MLSLGARDEHGRIYPDVEAPKLLMAGDVLRGCAGQTVTKISGQMNLLNISEFPFRVGAENRALGANGVKQQNLGRQAWRGDAGALKEVSGLP